MVLIHAPAGRLGHILLGLHFHFPALIVPTSAQPRVSYEHYSED
jgi:hypothetical protein